ncbi:MAG: peptidoglycan-binding domain-containing protein [Streptomyces sp.]
MVELQRRLKQAGALEQAAPEDGRYSSTVQQAVADYQARHRVRGDRYGEYGPRTRRALESHTTG